MFKNIFSEGHIDKFYSKSATTPVEEKTASDDKEAVAKLQEEIAAQLCSFHVNMEDLNKSDKTFRYIIFNNCNSTN